MLLFYDLKKSNFVNNMLSLGPKNCKSIETYDNLINYAFLTLL